MLGPALDAFSVSASLFPPAFAPRLSEKALRTLRPLRAPTDLDRAAELSPLFFVRRRDAVFRVFDVLFLTLRPDRFFTDLKFFSWHFLFYTQNFGKANGINADKTNLRREKPFR